MLLNEGKGMYERYAALFALRNDGGNEAIAAVVDSLGAKSALLRHEVSYIYISNFCHLFVIWEVHIT